MIDLHTHSTASDGTLTPSELVGFAHSKNISVLAITDHDTVSGLKEGAEAAAKAGVTFVPGIELNIEWTKGEFHLLGYELPVEPAYSAGVNTAPLEAVIEQLQKGRNERNRQMIQKMQDDGFPISYEEVVASCRGECMGRPHIAALLVEKKVCRTRQQAFDRFLGSGRPYYVGRVGASLSDAVSAIKTAGGIPVLAHPLSLYVSWGKMEETLRNIHEAGVLGLEAWHPGVRVGEAMRLEEYARKLGFFVTAGSDFHGEKIRVDRHIGHTAGSRKIEDRFWTDELGPALASRPDSAFF